MASALAKPYLSPEEYLILERQAERKHEYHAGELFALAGASKTHNRIVANLIGELHQQFKGTSCSVYPSDLRVQIDRSGPFVYPDVVVTCGTEQYHDAHADTLLNPVMLIDVLSKSSADYDHSQKLGFYRRLPSLISYVMVAQSRPAVEHYERQPDQTWVLTDAQGLESVLHLNAVKATLPLRDIYAQVALPDRPPTTTF